VVALAARAARRKEAGSIPRHAKTPPWYST